MGLYKPRRKTLRRGQVLPGMGFLIRKNALHSSDTSLWGTDQSNVVWMLLCWSGVCVTATLKCSVFPWFYHPELENPCVLNKLKLPGKGLHRTGEPLSFGIAADHGMVWGPFPPKLGWDSMTRCFPGRRLAQIPWNSGTKINPKCIQHNLRLVMGSEILLVPRDCCRFSGCDFIVVLQAEMHSKMCV